MYKKILPYIFLVFIIITLFSCKDDPVDSLNISKPLFDIFPLKKGRIYTYSYDYSHMENTSVFNTIDSGYVQYEISDSIKLSNTSIQWKVKEILHIIRHQSIPAPPSSYPWWTDTTYLIDRQTLFSIEENLSGFHKLKCKSIVWTFPFVDSYKSDTTIIYRYSKENEYLIKSYKNYAGIVLCDTLSFNENWGLIFFRRDYYLEVMSGFREILKIKMIN